MKTTSSDSHFVGHTPSLLFLSRARSTSARHRKKMTPDPRSAAGVSTGPGFNAVRTRSDVDLTMFLLIALFALSCAIAFRASGPCALQSSAFKTADRALDHFSTPGRTRSPDGWSRACCCSTRARDGPWMTKLARTRVHARKGGQSWSLAMSEDGRAPRVVRCKISTPHPAYSMPHYVCRHGVLGSVL